ncbi:AbrB family transcriptional regulator [Anaerotalea alkaliphila]|uniref:AbrB family transcriptional regulator n=1 Tax=Anaerotalea alkaliphila TaxID=2662126 RepID=A0A7X5HVN3_9FIRM|nr:AbrB family transcriptional regulator [Anaerotalea alkaliphila]NDL67507.1 AbrB family transcriptional regulator [Anaerotalea alkaliphila]
MVGLMKKIPAAMMIGAIAATAVLDLTVFPMELPAWFLTMIKILAGTYIGHRFTYQTVLELKKYLKVSVFAIVWFLATTFVLGGVISVTSGESLTTALFASTPGGISDVIFIANDLGGEMTAITIFQIARLFSVYMIYPPMVRYFAARAKGRKTDGVGAPVAVGVPAGQKDQSVGGTLLIAALLGLVFEQLAIPAGAMLGAMLGSALYNETRGARLPKNTKYLVQIGAGITVGNKLNVEILGGFSNLLLPIGGLVVGLFVFTLVLAWLINRMSDIDFVTALMAVTPGGIQEVAVIAEDAGCDIATVMLIHTVRLMAVVMVFPTIIFYVVSMLTQ